MGGHVETIKSQKLQVKKDLDENFTKKILLKDMG